MRTVSMIGKRKIVDSVDRCNPAAPVMRGVNSPLFTEGALIRDPRAVPNLCKADSGLSAMFWYLGSNIVTSSGSLQDTFLYLLVSNSAPIVRAQDKGARIFGVGVVLLLGY